MSEVLYAADRTDLTRALSDFKCAVPERWGDRSADHRERYGLAHLLASIDASRLDFPIRVEKSERPDFIIRTSSVTIGLEHTEAVSINVARMAAMRQANDVASVYPLPRALPGEPKRTAAELRHEIESPPNRDPWVGNEVEREWAAAMHHFADAKVRKAHRSVDPAKDQRSWQRCDQNWLMIYDNWWLPHFENEEANELLFESLQETLAFSVFDVIFVLTTPWICEFSAQTERPTIWPLRKPGAARA